MKTIHFHKVVTKELEKLGGGLRGRIAEFLRLLAIGKTLGMPQSRPMPGVAPGVHELRIKDTTGNYRIFYYVKIGDKLLVFHFFKKKTQRTPEREIKAAKKRLEDMRDGQKLY